MVPCIPLLMTAPSPGDKSKITIVLQLTSKDLSPKTIERVNSDPQNFSVSSIRVFQAKREAIILDIMELILHLST